MAGSDSDSDTSSSAIETKFHQVLGWYSKLYSRRVDIVGDYAGNELFLIEGDSILLNCFSDKHLDFDPGFQLLHATYAVENFLRGLVSRRCNFHVAFFENHRELCVPPSASDGNQEKYLLARAVIIRHLSVNLKSAYPDIEVHVFPSIRSKAFAEYLEATDLYFIMCHDGASSRALPKKNITSKTPDALEDEYHDVVGHEMQTKTIYRLFIHWFMERGYNAALVNGLEWRDTKVITTVLESIRRSKRRGWTEPHIFESSSANESEIPVDQDVLERINSSRKQSLSEREYLTILCISKFAVRNGVMHEYGSALLRHTALLSELPISERRITTTDLPNNAEAFLARFSELSRTIIDSQSWSSNISKFSAHCDIADLVDGRLFAACVHDYRCGRNMRYKLLIDAVGLVCGTDLASAASNRKSAAGNRAEPGTSAIVNPKGYKVLPFANSVFDTHLSPVHLAVDRSEEITDATSAQIFREVSHWHNSNRPIDSKGREEHAARSQKQQFFARRRNQWFMAEMMAYAGSLTNAIGKVLDPETITSGANSKLAPPLPSEKRLENAKPKGAPKVNKKGSGKVKQAMIEGIAASKKSKDEASSEKVFQGWQTTCAAFESEPLPAVRYRRAKQHLGTLNTDFKLGLLEAEVRLYMLHVLLGMWIMHCGDDTKEQGLPLAALIFDTISSFSKVRGAVSKTICNNLTATIKALKLPQLEVPVPSGDRALAFNFALRNSAVTNLSIPLSAKQFQLLHCGPYFERSMDSAPDHRVPFEPDGWQRKVLDEIDAKRSLLVIAPTSAGKTFISFYAMKQVLKSNDDDILVYVAPTKALVNQIAAEVQARFSKKYKYGGKSVWGIHTRDMRINNPTGCQILVTVPHILQIMLLAPSNANAWSKRVKWIIFDEVHCIGQADDGLIWEQLLLLAPCPIIALSATIGNPQEFNAWLISTQKAIGNELVMVQHPHRYSDLRKFIYNPPTPFTFEGLSDSRAFARLGLDGSRGFTFIHPVASLVNRARGMPDDLSFEARDCQMLWESMSRHQTPEFKVDKSLDPANALPSVIRKIDIIKWEASLKTLLREWLANKDSPFDKVIQDLGGPLQTLESRKRQEPQGDDIENGDPDRESGVNVETTLPLLVELHRQDALPGIIFNYDRSLCEDICRALVNQLAVAETAWKESSPKWKAKLEAWEAWKRAVAKAGKRGPPKVSKKKGAGGDDEALSKADLMRDTASTETSPWVSFNPENPVDGFHFADSKKMTQEELARYFKELIRREVPGWLLDALRRGVGVHHAGMNRKYRQVVEMLFRKGFLRVVVATGTLALGINMPCKTVVFSGDSVFLTALNYRQAAGRAGRRGFDMLGNVVFHGVSISKVHRLISSRLPDLNGHFPITTTLVLRLFTLLNESKNSPFAVRSINALLSQPRLYLGGEESKMTVLHHLRFSIEYLRRQYLLDSSGAPLNFAGCVSHLYFTENSSFAFHALLKDGFFHNLCAKVDKKTESVLRKLMLTMAHLFGRQHCRQADEEFVEEVVKKSPSVVFLPPIPKKAAKILREHNGSTLSIFTAYVQTFVEQHVTDPDDALPLTQMKIGGDAIPECALSLPRCPPTKVRSSFVALSGHDDNFESIHDLCQTSRSGVFLEEAVVPYVGLYPEESEMPLNAYLYDFFMHGDTTALAKANRIRRGDVWFVLNDFSMVLATIVTSLSNFMKLTPESDLDFTEVRGEGDEEEERQEDKFVPDDSGYETASTTSVPGKGGPVKQDIAIRNVKKSKKVADSWDDDAEEEIEEELAAKETERKLKAVELQDKPAWEEGAGLLNVLKAFKMLREEFDTKFRAMWA